jgi:hypothetical protein
MTQDDFISWSRDEFEEEMKIMNSKGQEYTVSNPDKLFNFKSIGERYGLPPQLIASVYLTKHMDSIRNYVLHGTEACDESIQGRLRDARNYLLLLGALIKEQQEAQPSPPPGGLKITPEGSLAASHG